MFPYCLSAIEFPFHPSPQESIMETKTEVLLGVMHPWPGHQLVNITLELKTPVLHYRVYIKLLF